MDDEAYSPMPAVQNIDHNLAARKSPPLRIIDIPARPRPSIVDVKER